jgi:WD40 repeat protein
LIDLLIAERIVLFYSPSGAGKTSLLQARLIPRLSQRGFNVLPLIRVHRPTEGPGFNRYVASALLSLDETVHLGEYPTFGSYLDRLLEATPARQLLIFDQFEEILTVDVTDYEVKREFFVQVGEALLNRKRWAIFSMREDYVPGLDPYLKPVPTCLGNTYRLDLLKERAALEAIQEPARQAGVTFVDEAASKLVGDLARVQVQLPNGGVEPKKGLYIEPVQLQVVCFRIWGNLTADDLDITEDDVEHIGNVNTALADYYQDAVYRVAVAAGERERAIREWFDRELITPQGMRGQVLMEPDCSRGLSNQTIRKFEDAHLVRVEQRDRIWFELAHDRLVEPIRTNNASWFNANLSAFQRQAELWSNQQRHRDYLITGQTLAEAEEWARIHEVEITPTEKDFLADCRAARAAAEREQKQNRRIRYLAVGASTLLVMTLIALALALWSYSNATEQQRLAHSRELTARAILLLTNDPEQSLLLALQAVKSVHTPEADNALRQALGENRLRAILRGHQTWVASAVFSRDGERILTASGDGTARIWDSSTSDVLLELRGHTKQINTATFSPDGKYVVTASDDNSARIWDVSKCSPDCSYVELAGHTQRVGFAGFSPDSMRVATASDDGTACVWDAVTGQMLLLLKGHNDKVNRIVFSPDGKWIATSSEDNTARIWDAGTGQIWKVLGGHQDIVSKVTFSPDGQYVATASEDNTARIWNVITGELVTELTGHTGRLTDITFSSDGKYIATASSDQTARVWEWRSARLVSELRGHTAAVNSVMFSKDGQLILTASADHTARLWETSAGHTLVVFRGHTHWVYSAAFSPNGDRIITTSADGTARVWEANPTKGLIQLQGHERDVNSAMFSPDGKYVVTASSDTNANVWDVTTGRIVHTLAGHKVFLNRAAFSPDGRFVATAGDDNKARVWDLENCTPDCSFIELIGHTLGVKSARFSPDGEYVVTASDDNTARIWDTNTGQVIHVLQQNDWVKDAAFSPNGQFIVTASAEADPVATIWDARTGNLVCKLRGHKDAVTSADFSPDGKWIVTTSRDNTTRVWDWQACRTQADCLITTLPSSDWALDATFSHDGKWLVISSRGGIVRVWEWQSGRLISELAGQPGEVYSSAFSPDDQFLVTASSDGIARIWPRVFFAPFDEVIASACRQSTPELASNASELCSTP